MDLPFYSKRQKLSPNDTYLNHLQALIDDRWENSTQTKYDVLVQDEIGAETFSPVEISIDAQIESGTGFKLGDDYKIFSYRKIDTEVPNGLMYQYAENYWIATNTNKLASNTSSVSVRRCNNELRWINPENGFINKIPCIIDYELASPQPSKDKDIVVASGHIVVTTQGNNLTRTIPLNQRFIFKGQVFKVSANQDMLIDDIDYEHATMIRIDMYKDTLQADDDLKNQVADALDINYSVSISNPIAEQIKGFKGKLYANTFLNGDIVNRDIVWSGSDNCTVDLDGGFELIGEVGSTAIIKATLNGNSNVFAECSINIVDVVEDIYEIVVTPEFTEIKQNVPMEFSVNLYKNGVMQNNDVSVSISGVDSSYYTLVQDGNNFVLTSKKVSKNRLLLVFSANDITKEMAIQLKSFY